MSASTATERRAAVGVLAQFVTSRIDPLQGEYLRGSRTGRADARLARLVYQLRAGGHA